MSKGLILGKFMPLHSGHVWAIEVASKLVDELVVLVCTQDHDPIDGELRLNWVDKIIQDNAKACWLTQPMPQKPEDHPDFWKIWRTEIQKRFGQLDKVFGGDDYVIELAEQLNATPVPLGRNTVNISATEIRNDYAKHWQHVPRVVRPYYQKRVTILGPESVGKSSLAVSLAHMYSGSTLITEHGRLYDELLKDGDNWVSGDFHAIAETHKAIRETTMLSGGPLIVEDTDAIQTMAWCKQLIGTVDPDYNIGSAADWYLLLAPDVPWIDDGTRYGDKHRQAMFEFIHDYLLENDLNHTLISGDWSIRKLTAIDAIDALVRDRADDCTEANHNTGN